jgi:molybdopterin molybdotransferase
MGVVNDRAESITVEEAVTAIAGYPSPGGRETLPLADCLGRVLADDIVAAEPVPAHASSAMDGYAYRHADLAHGATSISRLPIQGRVAAGHPLDEQLRDGYAVRIFTGGVIPAGADTVAMQEHCTTDGSYVELPMSTQVGANIRLAGDDIASGTRVLTAGARLRPQDIGLAASVGLAALRIHRRVKVGLATTGDELRAPGEPLPAGCVRDSNRHTIGALLRGLGAEVTDYGNLRDDRDHISDTLARAAAANDLVVTTGGVSVGDEDHVRPAVEAIGKLAFWRLPIKPGRPIAVGDIGGTPFVGLPGNPVSVMVAFFVIGRPLVLHLSGATELGARRFPVIADFEHRRAPGRREFLRGRLLLDQSGTAMVSVYRSNGSGMLSSLTWSDGLVDIPEQQGDVRPGDRVQFIPYSELMS